MFNLKILKFDIPKQNQTKPLLITNEFELLWAIKASLISSVDQALNKFGHALKSTHIKHLWDILW